MFPAGPISACTGRKILIRRAETLDNAQELSNRDENPPVLRCGLKLSSLTTLMPNPQDLWPASRMVSSLSRKLSNRCSNSETSHFSSLRFSKKQSLRFAPFCLVVSIHTSRSDFNPNMVRAKKNQPTNARGPFTLKEFASRLVYSQLNPFDNEKKIAALLSALLSKCSLR
jgi:hypothetical protein